MHTKEGAGSRFALPGVVSSYGEDDTSSTGTPRGPARVRYPRLIGTSLLGLGVLAGVTVVASPASAVDDSGFVTEAVGVPAEIAGTAEAGSGVAGEVDEAICQSDPITETETQVHDSMCPLPMDPVTAVVDPAVVAPVDPAAAAVVDPAVVAPMDPAAAAVVDPAVVAPVDPAAAAVVDPAVVIPGTADQPGLLNAVALAGSDDQVLGIVEVDSTGQPASITDVGLSETALSEAGTHLANDHIAPVVPAAVDDGASSSVVIESVAQPVDPAPVPDAQPVAPQPVQEQRQAVGLNDGRAFLALLVDQGLLTPEEYQGHVADEQFVNDVGQAVRHGGGEATHTSPGAVALQAILGQSEEEVTASLARPPANLLTGPDPDQQAALFVATETGNDRLLAELSATWLMDQDPSLKLVAGRDEEAFWWEYQGATVSTPYLDGLVQTLKYESDDLGPAFNSARGKVMRHRGEVSEEELRQKGVEHGFKQHGNGDLFLEQAYVKPAIQEVDLDKTARLLSVDRDRLWQGESGHRNPFPWVDFDDNWRGVVPPGTENSNPWETTHFLVHDLLSRTAPHLLDGSTYLALNTPGGAAEPGAPADFVGGLGDDNVILIDADQQVVAPGAGNDQVTIVGGAENRVDLGAGFNTVVTAGTDTTDLALVDSQLGFSTVALTNDVRGLHAQFDNNGRETVVVYPTAVLADADVQLGDGPDVFYTLGTVDDTTVGLGGGKDRLFIDGRVVGSNVDLGKGNDFARIGSGFTGSLDLSDPQAAWVRASKVRDAADNPDVINENDTVVLVQSSGDTRWEERGDDIIQVDADGNVIATVGIVGEGDHLEQIVVLTDTGETEVLQYVEPDIRHELGALKTVGNVLTTAAGALAIVGTGGAATPAVLSGVGTVLSGAHSLANGGDELTTVAHTFAGLGSAAGAPSWFGQALRVPVSVSQGDWFGVGSGVLGVAAGTSGPDLSNDLLVLQDVVDVAGAIDAGDTAGVFGNVASLTDRTGIGAARAGTGYYDATGQDLQVGFNPLAGVLRLAGTGIDIAENGVMPGHVLDVARTIPGLTGYDPVREVVGEALGSPEAPIAVTSSDGSGYFIVNQGDNVVLYSRPDDGGTPQPVGFYSEPGDQGTDLPPLVDIPAPVTP